MDESTILTATDLVKIYGRRRVVDGVSYNVKRGEIVGLLGSNGAGKTTSFRMTCGMVTPNQGRVYLNGKDVTTWPMYKRCREGGMGYLAQKSSVFQKLTVEQNLLGVMELLPIDAYNRKQRCEELLERFDIEHIRKSKAKGLSGGEARRLEIARCLVSDPEIIMLDEPFAGIDPVTVDSIQKVIWELRQSGISILITDHQAEKTLEIVDRCYVVHRGKILCQGKPDEVVRHPDAIKYYFGDLSRQNFGDGTDVDVAA